MVPRSRAQLRAQGVEVIFGLPGDQLMSALDALVDVPEIRYLVTRHEQATTYMADGYARAGGRPGVAMVVPGVGVYNAASGLATAYACSSPVLLIAGQVNRDGIGRDLGCCTTSTTSSTWCGPITKLARRVLDPAEIPARGARRVPRHDERPSAPGGDRDPAGDVRRDRGDRVAGADRRRVRRGRPRSARAGGRGPGGSASRPLIVAGGGVVLGDASDALTAVAELLQAPVITTREGKGAIDDRHPLSVGTMWVNPRMRPVIDAADVVLAVGQPLPGLRPRRRSSS